MPRYFIAYVRTTSGGFNTHNDFENDFVETRRPITREDIRKFEEEKTGALGDAKVIFFNEVSSLAPLKPVT